MSQPENNVSSENTMAEDNITMLEKNEILDEERCVKENGASDMSPVHSSFSSLEKSTDNTNADKEIKDVSESKSKNEVNEPLVLKEKNTVTEIFESETEDKKEFDEMSEDDGDNNEHPTEKLKPGLLEQPVLIEGGRKRERKKTEHLKMADTPPPKDKTIEIRQGQGEKLGDLPRIEMQLSRTLSENLKALHKLLYGKIDSLGKIKKNIRAFSGYDFTEGSAEYKKKEAQISKMNISAIKVCCTTLDVMKKGTKDELVKRLLSFLIEPKNSGKSITKSKKKASGKKRKSEGKTTKKAKRQKKSADDNVDNDDEDSDDELSEDDDQGSVSSIEEKKNTPKAKKPATKKTVKKNTKKAVIENSDLSSSDDDDVPLIKKKSAPPTDNELISTIKKILKGADLEKVTMKTVCKDVYGKYPDFDLSERKSFIKDTVKEIIR